MFPFPVQLNTCNVDLGSANGNLRQSGAYPETGDASAGNASADTSLSSLNGRLLSGDGGAGAGAGADGQDGGVGGGGGGAGGGCCCRCAGGAGHGGRRGLR